jgi:hypothetical protein
VVARAGAVAAAAGLAGAVPGGGGGDTWPKEVNTRVTEQRLAISSVFIGLIGKFLSGWKFRYSFRLFILNEVRASPAKLSRLSV